MKPKFNKGEWIAQIRNVTGNDSKIVKFIARFKETGEWKIMHIHLGSDTTEKYDFEGYFRKATKKEINEVIIDEL